MILYKSNFELRNVKFYTTPIDSSQLFHKLRKLLYRLRHWFLTDISETILLISTALQTAVSTPYKPYRIQNFVLNRNKIKFHSNFLVWELVLLFSSKMKPWNTKISKYFNLFSLWISQNLLKWKCFILIKTIEFTKYQSSFCWYRINCCLYFSYREL